MKLPFEIRKRINRYQRWQDRQSSLVGKILLCHALENLDYNHDCLTGISVTQHGRPSIDDEFDFNISHSGGCVVCAITKVGRVGIDIEKVNKISMEDFTEYFSRQEWDHIRGSKNPYPIFYRYWTMYESILKADGRGLSSEFSKIALHNNMAELDEKSWFVNALNIHPDYICSIATDTEQQHFNLLEITCDDLIRPPCATMKRMTSERSQTDSIVGL